MGKDHLPSGVICPALLEGKPVEFTVDSGCDLTTIDTQYTESLNLQIIPRPSLLTPAGQGVLTSPGFVIISRLEVGKYVLRDVQLLVADIQHCCKPTIGLLGMDLFPQLGIYIGGVPITYPQAFSKDAQVPDIPVVSKNMKPYKAPEHERQQLFRAIQPLLDENAAIPASSLCTHPSAVVTLDTGTAPPTYVPQYKLSDYMSEFVDAQVKIWDVNGVTVPAPKDSPWNNPIIGALDEADRRNGKAPRICIDPRRLNDLLPDDPRSIPTVDAIHQRIYGFDHITEIDLTKSFNQFTVAELDRIKTTFTWRNFKRMFRGSPFGLKTLSQLFQSVIEQIFHDHTDVTTPFIDNIYVHTKGTIQDHIEAVKKVLALLNLYKLRINVKKCFFGYKAVLVLGHVLSSTTKSVDMTKISALEDWPRPTTGKHIESFLGFTNYLRDFVPLYAEISEPLEKLRKVRKIGDLWSADCEASFQMFKKVLSEAPVLNKPLPDVPYCIATDASQFGLGWVLYQQDPNTDSPRYIKFGAKSLNKAQKNYGATRRELLAVVTAIQDCRDYVYGRKFELFTDHKSLTFLMTQTKLNYMQLNAIDILFDYNFNINHRPGIEMVLPDGLSRMFREFRATKGECGASVSNTISGNTRRLQLADLPRTPDKELCEYINERFNKELLPEAERKAKMESIHQLGHFGADVLFKSLWDQGFYWPGMRVECEKLVNSCMPCLRFNIGKAGFHPRKYVDAQRPFEHIVIDTITGFETTPRGNNIILVITDICTRFKIVLPQKTKNQSETARNLWKVMCTFPTPKIIGSDNGTEFCNSVITELLSLHGVLHKTIAAYNPRANGTAENAVGNVQDILRKITNGDMTDWDLFLPAVQLALNAKPNVTTGTSPASLLFGMNIGDFSNYDVASSTMLSVSELSERAAFLNDVLRPAALSNFRRKQQKRAAATSRRQRQVKPLPIGTLVMLSDPTRSSKHDPKYTGPYRVVQQKRGGNYVLQEPDGKLHHRNPPIDQMKIIDANSEVPFEDTHYIERILDHRGNGIRLEYLVKWLNYPSSENTWEPIESLTSCEETLASYWQSRHGNSVPATSSATVVSSSSSSSSSSRASSSTSSASSSTMSVSRPSSSLSRKRKAPLSAAPVQSNASRKRSKRAAKQRSSARLNPRSVSR